MYCLETFFPKWRDSIIHESSPGARGASPRLRAGCANYIPSQYFPDVTPGEMHRGFRCENLEALTFADESIDLHVTQDVCEHIFAPDKAFREIARTLRPGGAHIFTVPLVNKDQPTEFRARMNADGSVEHLVKPPEYHGNPISEKGSLVTVHWGYDICEYIHSASGLYTQIVYIDALDLGIRAEFIEVLITRKPTRP
jgi:SAM-dependent methyltransferase